MVSLKAESNVDWRQHSSATVRGIPLRPRTLEPHRLSTSLSQSRFAWLRRLIEIIVASAVLMVTSPIMLVIAILIKLDSPGPALFRQERVGLHGRLILFWKFRTMYSNARDLYPDLYTYKFTPEEVRRVRLKQIDDPRVTRVGKWLRKSTLDELPNFWNLLTGDVAIVGPRPDIAGVLPYFLRHRCLSFLSSPALPV